MFGWFGGRRRRGNSRAGADGVPAVAVLAAVALVVAFVAFGRAGSERGSSPAMARSVSEVAASDARVSRIAFKHRLLVPKRVVPKPAPRLVPLVRAGVAGRPLRILVVGDSVGVTFARGLELWAGQRGNVRVLDEAHYWCALGRNAGISQGWVVTTPSTGCTDWGTRWADAIRTFDPDVTFVLFSIWEVASLWFVNRHTIPRLAGSRPAVHVVDLDHELCSRGASHSFAGVSDARPDGAHFSEPGALAVANWVMPIVLGTAPNPVSIGERDPAPSERVTRRAS